MLCGGVRSSKMMVRWRVRYVGCGGTVRWVQWVRYGGYGGYGTGGTVGTVRGYAGYGTGGYAVGTVRWVRWVRTCTHRTVPTVPTVPYPPCPPYRTHCTHCTVPTVPTVPYPPYPPYRTHRKCHMYQPVLNHQKTCFSFLLKLDNAKHCVFRMFEAPEGRQVGSLKRRVRSQLARWEMKNCTPLWREAHFQVKMYKTPQLRSTFRSCDVEKEHAVVARSTFASQNVQNPSFGALLEVAMSKKSTPLWREAHLQVNKLKAPQLRSTFRSHNVQNTPGSDHFWKLRCRKSARRCGAKHISKSKCTKH